MNNTVEVECWPYYRIPLFEESLFTTVPTMSFSAIRGGICQFLQL